MPLKCSLPKTLTPKHFNPTNLCVPKSLKHPKFVSPQNLQAHKKSYQQNILASQFPYQLCAPKYKYNSIINQIISMIYVSDHEQLTFISFFCNILLKYSGSISYSCKFSQNTLGPYLLFYLFTQLNFISFFVIFCRNTHSPQLKVLKFLPY